MTDQNPPNIDVFNRVVSKVLADLYHSFPNPQDIDPATVGWAIVDEDRSYEEMFADIHETSSNSIQYLLDQGLVKQSKHYRSWSGPEFKSLVLTEDGLRLLDAVPESVDRERDSRTLADRLIESASSGQWGIASQLAKEALATYRKWEKR